MGPWKSRLNNLAAFRALREELGCDLEASDDISSLTESVQVNHLVIPNSLAVHPMEGVDSDDLGQPGPLTIRRYNRFAAGGAGLL